MESEKQFKERNNSMIKENSYEESQDEVTLDAASTEFESQFNFSPQTEALLENNISKQAVENIKHIFNKTQTVRKVADVRHQEIQTQFKELRDRLHMSSQSLNRLTKCIDNVKFSYQKKFYEMHRTLTPFEDNVDTPKMPENKQEMEKQIEEIKDKIEKMQQGVIEQKEKHNNVTLNYKDAFENVSAALEKIESGEYSSMKLNKE